MSCVPAPACKAALAEATRLHPKRSRVSDGICGDPAHQARKSKHNTGDAFDLTHDPVNGVNCEIEAERLRLRCLGGVETRATEIIWNRRIATRARGWEWRPYSGSNPHDKHMHVSIDETRRNDTSPWFESGDEELSMDAEVKSAFQEVITRLNVANHEIRQLRQQVVDLTAKVDKSHPGTR